MLKEYISPDGEKPSPCLKEGESNSAAMKPTDITTVQVPDELQGQSQPAAVTPVEIRKSKMKSEHPDKDKKGGPSQATGESEIVVISESLPYESLCNLHKDIVQWGCEAYTTWLLQVWDLMGTSVPLVGGEATIRPGL